ncbi:TonB-dependent receptor [Bordetella sp. BOR01]|uniref:TonB-dependent receptor n=1 Tax=Bordetella sp. BOR01 TaxID=2854779 RepID=UPI001C44D351|nr:TonB-dependent receptor [Bordetella sp. BOR01]MBV7482993.1 TonB-dependent receptor [Bordetella sp. BOR01]
MVFRRPRSRRLARGAGLASSSTIRSRGDALLAFKAKGFVFVIGCALAGAAALAPSPVLAAESATGSASREYALSAGRLSDVLAEFAAASGVQLIFDPNILAGLRSSGLQGRYGVREGFARLLAGSGYELVDMGARRYSLRQMTADDSGAINLAPVTVTGTAINPNSTMTPMPAYAGGQIARGGQVGMLGNKDVMDTPFSLISYTNKTIQDQQARTVQDVLNNDPSVVASTSSGTPHDYQVIRGFGGYGIDGTRTLNGVAGMAPLFFPSADYIERVEILKGPSALLNGMTLASAAVTGALGGSVNLVTKRATEEPITELTARYVSKSQIGTHLDVGRRFGASNEFGIRFNGSIDGGHTPIDTQHSRIGSAALNLDYAGDRVRLSADFAHQSQKLDPNGVYIQARSVADSLSSFPRAPSSTVSLVPSGSEYKTKSTMGLIRGEVDILDNVTAYAAIGKQSSEADLNGYEKVRLLDSTGRYSIAREIQHYSRDILSMQGGIRATVNTGPVDHALSLNLSRSELTYKRAESEGASSIIDSIYNPVFPSLPSVADPGDPVKSSQTTASSIGFADTLSILDERIQFMAGIRYQEAGIKNFDTKTGLLSSKYDSNAWTPAFGLVVKPWQNVSLYANYIEDLRAGTIVGTTYANAGEVFPPYTTKQYEAGVKADWGQVMTTLAVFQITKPSSIAVDDPASGASTLTQDGEERTRGIELNAYGELMRGVRLMGGLTLLDARLTKTEGGTLDGKRNDTAPKVRAVIGAEWDTPFVEGLTLTGRLTHTGDAVVSTTSGVTIPSWTTVDLGARYAFNSPWNKKPITVRFNVDNVFDKDYWAGTYASGFVYRGQPRTFRLSATFAF